MKKAIFMLAAFGMMAASAGAQTQRLNRTNTRNKQTTITTIKNTEPTSTKTDGTLDLSRNPGNGATGVDGTINDATTSGNNNSSSIIEQRNNHTVEDNGATTVKPGAPGSNTSTNTTTR